MGNRRKLTYLSRTNLHRVEKRLLHVLNIDVIYLCQAVEVGPLDKTQAENTRAYLKLIRDFKRQDEADAKDVPEDDLRKAGQE